MRDPKRLRQDKSVEPPTHPQAPHDNGPLTAQHNADTDGADGADDARRDDDAVTSFRLYAPSSPPLNAAPSTDVPMSHRHDCTVGRPFQEKASRVRVSQLLLPL